MRSSSAAAKIVALTILLSAIPCFSQEKIKLPVGASSKTLGYGSLWVAWKQAFLEDSGAYSR